MDRFYTDTYTHPSYVKHDPSLFRHVTADPAACTFHAFCSCAQTEGDWVQVSPEDMRRDMMHAYFEALTRDLQKGQFRRKVVRVLSSVCGGDNADGGICHADMSNLETLVFARVAGSRGYLQTQDCHPQHPL